MSDHSKKQKQDLPSLSLEGRYFHIFGENGKVSFQGIVRGIVNDKYVLVQYFDWFLGEESTMEIISVEQMARNTKLEYRSAGSWQFYEDADHMDDWYYAHKIE